MKFRFPYWVIFACPLTVDLTLDDIPELPAVTPTEFIECAGNGQSFFAAVQGRPASGTQWLLTPPSAPNRPADGLVSSPVGMTSTAVS